MLDRTCSVSLNVEAKLMTKVNENMALSSPECCIHHFVTYGICCCSTCLHPLAVRNFGIWTWQDKVFVTADSGVDDCWWW